MAAIRARLASGEEPIAPIPDNVLYDDYQIARRPRFEEEQLSRSRRCDQGHEGKGHEPPQGEIVLTTHMAPYLYGALSYTQQHASLASGQTRSN